MTLLFYHKKVYFLNFAQIILYTQTLHQVFYILIYTNSYIYSQQILNKIFNLSFSYKSHTVHKMDKLVSYNIAVVDK